MTMMMRYDTNHKNAHRLDYTETGFDITYTFTFSYVFVWKCNVQLAPPVCFFFFLVKYIFLFSDCDDNTRMFYLLLLGKTTNCNTISLFSFIVGENVSRFYKVSNSHFAFWWLFYLLPPSFSLNVSAGLLCAFFCCIFIVFLFVVVRTY